MLNNILIKNTFYYLIKFILLNNKIKYIYFILLLYLKNNITKFLTLEYTLFFIYNNNNNILLFNNIFIKNNILLLFFNYNILFFINNKKLLSFYSQFYNFNILNSFFYYNIFYNKLIKIYILIKNKEYIYNINSLLKYINNVKYRRLFNIENNLKQLNNLNILYNQNNILKKNVLIKRESIKNIFFIDIKKEYKNLSTYFSFNIRFNNSLKLFHFLEIKNKLCSFYNSYNIKYNSNYTFNFNNKIFTTNNANDAFLDSLHFFNYKIKNFNNNKIIDNYLINNLKYLYLKEHLIDLLNNKSWFIKLINLQSNWFYYLDLNFNQKNFFFTLKKKNKILNSKSFILKSWTPRILKIAKKSARDKYRLNIIEEAATEVGNILKNNYNILPSKLIIILKTNLRLKYNLKALAGLRVSGYFLNKTDNNSIEYIKYLNKVPHNGIRKKKARRL